MAGYAGLSGLGQAGDEVGAVSVGTALKLVPDANGEVQKSQAVRLWDVLFLAPFLGYVAYKGKLTQLDRWSLAAIGVATAYYNGRNWLANRAEET